MKYLSQGASSPGWTIISMGHADRSLLTDEGRLAAKASNAEIISESTPFLARLKKYPFLKVGGEAIGWIGLALTLSDIYSHFFSKNGSSHPMNFFSKMKDCITPAMQNLLLCPRPMQHQVLMKVCYSNASRMASLEEDASAAGQQTLSFLLLPGYLKSYPLGAECFTDKQRSTIIKLMYSSFLQFTYPTEGLSDDEIKLMFKSFDEAEDTPPEVRRIMDFVSYAMLSHAEGSNPEAIRSFIDAEGVLVPAEGAAEDMGFSELAALHPGSSDLAKYFALSGIQVHTKN